MAASNFWLPFILTTVLTSRVRCLSSPQLSAEACQSESALLQRRQSVSKSLARDEPDACQLPWRQCGGFSTSGAAWSRATCCRFGFSCKKENDRMSRCKPRSCALPWEQCGGSKDGHSWDGPTCCTLGFKCHTESATMSRCKPRFNRTFAIPRLGPLTDNPKVPHPADAPDVPARRGQPVHSTGGTQAGSTGVGRCVEEFGKCGGKTSHGQPWDGPTCCPAFFSCEVKNEWYSQCRPNPSTTTSAEDAFDTKKPANDHDTVPSTTVPQTGDARARGPPQLQRAQIGNTAASCAQEWGKCDGKTSHGDPWDGPSCCPATFTCTFKDAWYSQCRPIETPAAAPLASKTEGCVKKWGQCGGKVDGKSWTGQTCCSDGWTCQEKSEWYSQCLEPTLATTTEVQTPPAKDRPTTSVSAATPPGAAVCANKWEKCGGKKEGGKPWSGPTCCADGWKCQEKNEWYSQCLGSVVQTTTSAKDDSTTTQPLEGETFSQQTTTQTRMTTTSDKHDPATTKPPQEENPQPTTTTANIESSDDPDDNPEKSIPSTGTSKIRGYVTMWAKQEAFLGAQCEYAGPPISSVTDSALTPYMRSGYHCAIGDAVPGFGKGENCGKCYRLTSLNDDGQYGTPGKKGSAVLSVTDGGAGGSNHFDCILEGFQAITGATTGVFDIEFEETVCEDVVGEPVIINWADQNAWYCKMMLENIGGWGQLESVRACLDGGSCNELKQFSGATWTGCPTGEASSVSFELTQKKPSGETSKITCVCSEVRWPWPTGQRCKCPTNFLA